MILRINTRGREAGFTLLEMLVVLAVLGLVLGIVVSRGPSGSTVLDLKAQAGLITQALRNARGEAIATDRPVAFLLDAPSHRFQVGTHAPSPLAAQMQVSMQAVRAGEDQAKILFAPDGSTSGGRIALAQGQSHLLINVDWLTGRVSVTDAP
jgi:general secretion pathway protein H